MRVHCSLLNFSMSLKFKKILSAFYIFNYTVSFLHIILKHCCVERENDLHCITVFTA